MKRFALVCLVVKPGDVPGGGINLHAQEFIFQKWPRGLSHMEG